MRFEVEGCGACVGPGGGYDDMKQLAVKKTNELESRIDGIKDLERDAVRPAEQDTPMTRHIRMLENRFDKVRRCKLKR